MEAIRKHASRLREQVARQQQAVFKQFGAYGGSDSVANADAEFQQHQKLEKHFQRDIVRGVEGYKVTGSKQIEIGTKLSEDCRKYVADNTCTSGSTLSKAASNFAQAHVQMEKERGNLLKAFGTQDFKVARRQSKVRGGTSHHNMALKVEAAQTKLQDLKSNVATLEKEAMAAVELQQQWLTLQRLIYNAERTYHQQVLQILDQLESDMTSERQLIEAAPAQNTDIMPASATPKCEKVNDETTSPVQNGSTIIMGYFLGEVVYAHQAGRSFLT